MPYTIADIATILGAHTPLPHPESTILHLLTDSRRLSYPESSLFFALETAFRDGHIFIKDLYDQGVRNFVIRKGKTIDPVIRAHANILEVEQPLDALQQIAAYHRAQFHFPVIGITGSNGKTIVKEWLNQLLMADYAIVRTPRSFNSQIGVPLSIWEMNSQNNLGIFEAGISQPGEMEKLEKIIHPDIGILTNIGAAHDEGFANREEKLREKLQLFTHTKMLIIPSKYLPENPSDADLACPLFTWGNQSTDTLQITAIHANNGSTAIQGRYKGKVKNISIPFVDNGAIENAINCWCTLLYMGLDDAVITTRMKQLRTVDMRLQILPAINNCTLINDSYSFDINSLGIALSFLRQQTIKKSVIISDLAYPDIHNYEAIAELLQHHGIDRVVAIGTEWTKLKHLLLGKFEQLSFYPNVATFLQNIQLLNFNREAILLKGARKFAFERIARFLENAVHQTRLEINIPALAHNLQFYRKFIQPETKIVAMVKAFGYGCGSIEVATMAQYYHVNYLAVAIADEGVALRNSGITLPIIVMNFDEEAFDTIVTHHLEPNIFSFKIYHAFHHFLESQGIKNYPIHLKIDTGMHRLGFEVEEIPQVINCFRQNSTMHVRSVFSHFVASEDPNEDVFTNHQAALFLKATELLKDGLHYEFIRHICNTSGILRFPQYHLDMVRLGIGLYGVDSASLYQNELENVATLLTTIAQIHKIKAGETVGYNRKGKVFRDSTIATIRIGYADGFNRKLGNGHGNVYVNSQLAPILGNICMDMAMIDITDIPNVQEGDTVEIFGPHIPVSDLAKEIGTIPYEILTDIGQRIKRIYIEE